MQEILMRAGCYVAIIILGFVLRRKGFFGEEAFPVLSNIVVKITLPAAIISGAVGRTIDVSMLTIPLLGLGSGILCMVVAVALHAKRSLGEKAFAILNTSGYNIGSFVMPFTQSFLGPLGVAATSLFDIGNACVCLGGSHGVAATVKAGEGFNVRRILHSISRSIPFLTYVITALINLVGWDIPVPIASCAKIIGDANPFMAMLMIGVGFQISGSRSQVGTILRILVTRYSIGAILAFCFYTLLPFPLEVRQALVILCFSPVSTATPGFTRDLQEDAGLSSAISSITIVCSIAIIVTLLVVML